LRCIFSSLRFSYLSSLKPKDFEKIYGRWRDGELDNEQAAELCGFSVRTLYDRTAEWRKRDGRLKPKIAVIDSIDEDCPAVTEKAQSEP